MEKEKLKEFQSRCADFLSRNGMKSTIQRELIITEFCRAGGHISAEELHMKIRERHASLGLATVYRTLKLLVEAGLAEERRFNDGFTRYEMSHGADHHDHLVCTRCGRVEEFENEEIEKLQIKVARAHRFTITEHRLELYGLCGDCSD